MSTQIVNTYTFRQLESTEGAGRSPADAIARARAEAQEIRERAHAEGYEAGYAEGLERARAEAAPLMAGMAEAIRSIADTREELAETLTTQAGQLAMLTAEQIIAGTIEIQPERIVDVVRGALRRLADRHHVTVLVNPDDLELLAQSVSRLQTELGGIEHLDVQADRRIARGGAVAQTVYGEIDVSVAAQLQSARELVAAALAGDTSIAAAAPEGDTIIAAAAPAGDTSIVPDAGGEAGELVIADGV